jgi:hypothetical protein
MMYARIPKTQIYKKNEATKYISGGFGVIAMMRLL